MAEPSNPLALVAQAALQLVITLPTLKRRKDHQIAFQAPRFAVEELEQTLTAAGLDPEQYRAQYRKLLAQQKKVSEAQ